MCDGESDQLSDDELFTTQYKRYLSDKLCKTMSNKFVC